MSPFEKWMGKVENGDKVEDAEIIEDLKEVSDDFSDLPPRSKENGSWRGRNDNEKLTKATTREEKRIRRNAARKIMRSWERRAKLVGIDPLPARRPTKGQRKAWEKSIIAAENQASQSHQVQADNNKTPCKPKSQKQEVPKPPTHPKS